MQADYYFRAAQRSNFKIVIKYTEMLTWRCVGIHWCLDHQWTSFWGHGDSHFPFFMFSQGCLNRFCVDIWKKREISSCVQTETSCLLVHSVHLYTGWSAGQPGASNAWCCTGVCYTQLTPAHSKASKWLTRHGASPSEELLYLSCAHVAVCLSKSEKGQLPHLKDSSHMFWFINLFCANLSIITITIHWNEFAFTTLHYLHICTGLGQDVHEETVCKTHGSQQKSLMVKEVATHWPSGT